MAELLSADGSPVDAERAEIEREFAAAMAADANGAEASAPPKRKPPAGKPPAKRRGRPPKSEQARVSAAASAGLSDEQRADGVRGLVQVGAGVALVASKATANVAYKADAVTLASSADDWASACVSVAKADEKFARLVDKVAGVGPYGALITVAMSTGMQLARNHRPNMELPGTVDPAKLVDAAEAEPEPQAA